MLPRTCHVQPRALNNLASAGRGNKNASMTSNGPETCGKHTLASTHPSTPQNSTAPTTSNGPPLAKRTQNNGPVVGPPVQPELMGQGSLAQQGQLTVVKKIGMKDKDNDLSLIQTSSFYPGHDGPPSANFLNDHVHSRFGVARDTGQVCGYDNNNSDIETEAEWFDKPSNDAPKNPSKMSNTMALKILSWHESPSTTGSSASILSMTQASNDATSHKSGTSASNATPSHQANYQWPSDTDIIIFPGTNKVLLTIQTPLMQSIFHDAFEHLQASLLFIHAFPDPTLTCSIISEALGVATQSHLPQAGTIRNRLELDREYLSRMCHLLCGQIPLFRGEVKEQCARMIYLSFFSFGSPADIMEVVEMQLSAYRYTFPTTHGDTLKAPPYRTRPYRNTRIIMVIKESYFGPGTASYAYQFEDHFPMSMGDDRVLKQEVLILMVALVATALYATIHKWRSGRYHPSEFSANSYLNVYQGHIDTFHHIRENHPSAFHLMMSDIYAQASAAEEIAAVPIADLDLKEMDG